VARCSVLSAEDVGRGKSFLLEALTSVTGGLYFPSLEETEAVSLRAFSTRPDPPGRAGQPAAPELG